jgi:DNA-binding MarR family transcriptional regulator
MSLEQDIQQPSFRSEYHKAILNILHTQNYLVGKMTDGFKNFGITRQQYNVLRILMGRYPEPAAINVIRDRMLEKSDISRIVERLRIKGLIERQEGKLDKRSAEISISADGLSLLKKMKGYVEGLETFLHGLTLEETQQLNTLLDKVRAKDLLGAEKLPDDLEFLNQQEKI